MKLEAEKLALLKNYFITKPVLKAYLFGSYAKGEADSFSDIDILVDLDHSERIGLKFIQMQIELQEMLNRKVDLVTTKALSKYIKPLVEKEMELIYAR
jgi:predicted nucleotidyltransferase